MQRSPQPNWANNTTVSQFNSKTLATSDPEEKSNLTPLQCLKSVFLNLETAQRAQSFSESYLNAVKVAAYGTSSR